MKSPKKYVLMSVLAAASLTAAVSQNAFSSLLSVEPTATPVKELSSDPTDEEITNENVEQVAKNAANEKPAKAAKDDEKTPNWNESIWSTWHLKKSLIGGLLSLAKVREHLAKFNLHPAYLVGRDDSKVECKPEERHFRQNDGSCNDENTKLTGIPGAKFPNPAKLTGMAESRFTRNVADPSSIMVGDADQEVFQPSNGMENPIEIAQKLMARQGSDDESYIPAKFSQTEEEAKVSAKHNPEETGLGLNIIAAAWIQFQTHDWFNHFSPVTANDADDIKVTYNGEELSIPRTHAGKVLKGEGITRNVYDNENTHWWDGSQIYGSHKENIDCVNNPSSQKVDSRNRTLYQLRVCGKDSEEVKNEKGETVVKNRKGHLVVENSSAFAPDALMGTLPTKLYEGPTKNRSLPKVKEMTGFNQNWWVGLSFLHTLFVRNHNTIADELAARYEDMSSDEIFHKARLINSALMAKIHTVEWTPGILNHPYLNTAMNSNWYGLEKYLGVGKTSMVMGPIQFLCKGTGWLKEVFSKDARNVQVSSLCQILGGIVGAKKPIAYGRPFAMTEEFVAVYRMHSLLPEKFDHLQYGGQKVSLADTREEKSAEIVRHFGMNKVTEAMGKQYAGALVLNNFPRFLQKVKIPVVGDYNINMAAVDIVRDRERGIPRYNEFRRQLGLNPITKYSDLMPVIAVAADGKSRDIYSKYGVSEAQAQQNRATVDAMKSIYGSDEGCVLDPVSRVSVKGDGKGKPTSEPCGVEKIDLLIGTLSETYRPIGYGFGDTLFQVFINMASRRLQADRFYTKDYTAETYTKWGMRYLDEMTMTKIILKNFPEIDASIVPENAFVKWGKPSSAPKAPEKKNGKNKVTAAL